MEWKIGEIKQVNGEWYQCIENENCHLCSFYELDCKKVGTCIKDLRTDKKFVIYKKLEKVGEPFSTNILENKVWEQRYRLYDPMAILNGYWYHIDGYFIDIEIKQNKEDMEENNNAKHSNSENIGKNLKPFDLQAAKSGKPVCTRDGRKARIICFDRVTNYTNEYTGSLVVLITNPNGDEQSWYYTDKGILAGRDEYDNHKYDLMMLPEKKEGWINICRNLNTNKTELDTEDIYNTKEEALQNLSSMTYVTTVKIEWEE